MYMLYKHGFFGDLRYDAQLTYVNNSHLHFGCPPTLIMFSSLKSAKPRPCSDSHAEHCTMATKQPCRKSAAISIKLTPSGATVGPISDPTSISNADTFALSGTALKKKGEKKEEEEKRVRIERERERARARARACVLSVCVRDECARERVCVCVGGCARVCVRERERRGKEKERKRKGMIGGLFSAVLFGLS